MNPNQPTEFVPLIAAVFAIGLLPFAAMMITSYTFLADVKPFNKTSQNRKSFSSICRAGKTNSAPNRAGEAGTKSKPAQ